MVRANPEVLRNPQRPAWEAGILPTELRPRDRDAGNVSAGRRANNLAVSTDPKKRQQKRRRERHFEIRNVFRATGEN